MSGLASAFPLLAVLAVLALVAMLIRLDRFVSRGSLDAGPLHPVQAEPPGLKQTPWELQALDDQLHRGGMGRPQANLIATVNRLIDAAELGHQLGILPPNATERDVAYVISALEAHLELASLDQVGR